MDSIMSFGQIDGNISMDRVISASISKNNTPTDIQSLLCKNFDQMISQQIISDILLSEPEYIDVRGYDKNEQISYLYNYLVMSNYKTILVGNSIYQLIYNHQITKSSFSKYVMTIGHSNIIIVNNLREYEIICINDNLFHYNISLGKYTSESDAFKSSDHYKQKFGFKINYSNVKLIKYIDKYNTEFIQYNRNKKIENLLS